MTMWKCEVIEVRQVRCTYFVEADDELEAFDKAHDGVTDKEIEGELDGVSTRHVESVVRETSE